MEEEIIIWDGVGLPPVGAKVFLVEAGGRESQATIIAHGLDGAGVPIAIFQTPQGCGGTDSKAFKRDPEQVAAYEKSQAIKQMMEDVGCDTPWDEFGRLHEAGWRKISIDR